MKERSLFRVGLAGAVATMLCCVTPILVIALTGLGLSSLVVWIDPVVWPLFGFFLLLTGYALWKNRRSPRS